MATKERKHSRERLMPSVAELTSGTADAVDLALSKVMGAVPESLSHEAVLQQNLEPSYNLEPETLLEPSPNLAPGTVEPSIEEELGSVEPGAELLEPSIQLGTELELGTRSQVIEVDLDIGVRQAKKGRRQYKFSARITPEVASEFKMYCHFNSIPPHLNWIIVERALLEFMNRYPEVSVPGAEIKLGAKLIDDRLDDDISKRASTIIDLYQELTGNEWKGSDWDAYKKVREYPAEVVQVGMYLARFRKEDEPIKSFAYFVPEIQKKEHLLVKNHSEYIRYLQKKWLVRNSQK